MGGVPTGTQATVEHVYLYEIVFIEFEIEDVYVRLNSLRGDRFRQDDETALYTPAEHDLGRRFAVFFRYLNKYRVIHSPTMCKW